MRRWTLAAGVLAVLLLMPVLQLGGELLVGLGESVRMPTARLVRYVQHTVLLALGVGLFAAVAGVGTAWLATAYRFPGRDVLSWSLALPLALPSYIAAFAYSGMLDYTGPVQRGLRAAFGPEAGDWIPYEWMTSLPGLIVIMGAVLYPYVYLICRASFGLQSATLIEAARLFGHGGGRIFWRIALPLARPAIAAGLGLVLMETLNEYGAPQYFGVDTLCTGVVYAWSQPDEEGRALRLAALLVGMVAVVLAFERVHRRDRHYTRQQTERPLEPTTLTGVRGWLATLACVVPLALGFLLPVAQLLYWLSIGDVEPELGALVRRSFALGAAAAVVTTGAALFLVFACRLTRSRTAETLTRGAALGYAVPGAAIALGALALSLRIDRALGMLLLSGTIAALVWAYATRFFAVAHGAIESGFARIGHNIEEASRGLGAGPAATLRRVSLPLVRRSALAAGVLVFVDVLKELPLTMMMRGFGSDTLAIRAYQLAYDENLADAAAPALVIVALGLLPVAIAHRLTR